MQTVDKAMALLGHFCTAQPEIGLSELGRMAGFDKAATRRFLVALAKHGFIEQNQDNRKYRLGSAFLHFARIREATLPLTSIVQPILHDLASSTGETAHASILSGHSLSTIAVVESHRAIRANVDLAEPLPLYATASGLVCLAFGQKSLFEDYSNEVQIKRIAASTLTTKKALREKVAETFTQGFGRAVRSFDSDIIGTAAPIFDKSGSAFGAIAIAAVASRFDAATERDIVRKVLDAAMAVTRATGGFANEQFMTIAGNVLK